MIILESRSAPLYHSMPIHKLISSLKSNSISTHQKHNGICLTWSLSFARKYYSNSNPASLAVTRSIVELDQSKLSNNYKLTPVSDGYSQSQLNNNRMKARVLGDGNNKAEERSDKPITNLSRYIVRIHLPEVVKKDPQYDDLMSTLSRYDIKYY